jgi:methyl-accepting chemotaxis protein
MLPEVDKFSFRRGLGLTMVVAGVLGGGAYGIAVAPQRGLGLIDPVYMVFAVAILAVYIFAVFIPQRAATQELRAIKKDLSGSFDSLRLSLDELRHGDLVYSLDPGSSLPPETQHALEAATRSLAGLIQQIQSSSVEVATSAGLVQETASDLASGSSQQAAAVVEITATMEELARTAGQIATNAAGQAELAAQSEQSGHDGVAAVEAAVAGVEAVRERMEAIASRADTLGSRSREIYRVLELINDIAQETHILSLNAAIEASAAGEHGERFSVVADEVRRLAERSRESTESVRSLLDEFSGAIRAMVVATEEGSKAADQVLQRSRSTESSINHLSDALANTARTAREISLATQEQRTASDQVVLTLKEVSEVIQRMADGLKQFTGTAERLNQLALSIQLLTQSFRIESPHSLKHQAIGWSRKLTDFTSNLEAVEGCLQEVIRACPFLELVFLADHRGTMVSFVINRELVGDQELPGALGVGQSYTERPWFQAVAREERTALTSLYESLLTGDQCFSVVAAVKDPEGNLAGMLGFDVNVRNWTRI